MTFVRKIVFYAFVAVYFIVCPLTIGYALGYIYKPGEENRIVKSGLIYLSTLPPGAQITVNQMPHPEKTPAVLRGLVPGEYAIGLELDGHKAWMQKLPVEAEKATVLENILLLPSVSAPETVGGGRWEKLAALKDPFYLALGEGYLLSRSAVFDVRDASQHALIDAESPHASARILSFYAVADSAAALLRVREGGAEKYLWLDAQSRPPALSDVSALFERKPERVEWDVRAKNEIYSYAAGALDRHDAASLETRRAVVSDLKGYGLADRKIYGIDAQGRFKRYSEDGSVEAELLSDAALAETLFGEGRFFEIRQLDRQTFLFLRDDGALLSNRLPYRFVTDGVRGWDWEPQQKRLAVWQRDRLGVVDFGETHAREDVFEDGPQLVWTVRNAGDIVWAAWIHRGTQLLFQDGHGVFMLDLETYGKPTLHRLVDAKPSSAVYSRSLGRLFYVDPQTAAMRALEIVPKRQIPLLTFPERGKEKKKEGIQQL